MSPKTRKRRSILPLLLPSSRSRWFFECVVRQLKSEREEIVIFVFCDSKYSTEECPKLLRDIKVTE